MKTERALEIITAYGADAQRWPVDERAAVLALAAADASVAAAMAVAAGEDALLRGWAVDVQPRAFEVQVPAVVAGGGGVRRWFAGGALAAAVAAGIVLLAPGAPGDATSQVSLASSSVPSATAEGEALGSDAESFASVFTPTVDEDQLI